MGFLYFDVNFSKISNNYLRRWGNHYLIIYSISGLLDISINPAITVAFSFSYSPNSAFRMFFA